MEESAEIEQGDIVWGVPSLVATHPMVANRFRPPADIPTAEELDPPDFDEVSLGIRLHSDPVIVVPHTCDFYGPEKGRTHRERLVARIQKLAGSGIADVNLLRSGEEYTHTFFLPDWEDRTIDAKDYFVNLRSMTTVDASYLSRRRRLARLSKPAIICLRRRITNFFTDYAPLPSELAQADVRGGLLRMGRELVHVEDIRSVLGNEAAEKLLREIGRRPSQ